jgi:uncharacterized protein (DUF488 family)
MAKLCVYSIGHSTHELGEFVALLRENSIERIADVRTVPRSRKYPQFNTGSLAESLPQEDIDYVHLPKLGGWRKADPDSRNGGWRHKSFRGYADYAMTADFAEGIDELIALAEERPTAMMCSEALWWRCHRRLVSDQLLVRGGTVLHVGSDGRTTPHELTDFAELGDDGRITYPAPD